MYGYPSHTDASLPVPLWGEVLRNLPDGAVCMCSYSYQHEDSEFQFGDHVTLVVQRFERDKRQMHGKILSKR